LFYSPPTLPHSKVSNFPRLCFPQELKITMVPFVAKLITNSPPSFHFFSFLKMESVPLRTSFSPFPFSFHLFVSKCTFLFLQSRYSSPPPPIAPLDWLDPLWQKFPRGLSSFFLSQSPFLTLFPSSRGISTDPGNILLLRFSGSCDI